MSFRQLATLTVEGKAISCSTVSMQQNGNEDFPSQFCGTESPPSNTISTKIASRLTQVKSQISPIMLKSTRKSRGSALYWLWSSACVEVCLRLSTNKLQGCRASFGNVWKKKFILENDRTRPWLFQIVFFAREVWSFHHTLPSYVSVRHRVSHCGQLCMLSAFKTLLGFVKWTHSFDVREGFQPQNLFS